MSKLVTQTILYEHSKAQVIEKTKHKQQSELKLIEPSMSLVYHTLTTLNIKFHNLPGIRHNGLLDHLEAEIFEGL